MAFNIPPIIGLIYIFAVIPLVAFLMYMRKFTRQIRLTVLLITVILGFVVLPPLLPIQFQALITHNTAELGGPIIGVMMILFVFFVITLVVGRIFCGYICPIGAVQELAYEVPIKKVQFRNKNLLFFLRLIVLLIFFTAGFFLSIGILNFFGITQFFHLNIGSILFFVFLIVLFISVFVYRPFCRIICPFGALFSLVTIKSLFKLKQSDECIECKKCEAACPTGEAGWKAYRGECYLCWRCVEACPGKQPISYKRSNRS